VGERREQLEGVSLTRPPTHLDDRGWFRKPYTRVDAPLTSEVWEHYVTSSREGVVRGLHFQLPPASHDKVVTCLRGAVFDVVVDLRPGSATYGDHVAYELDGDRGEVVWVPRGFAHGFQAFTDDTVLSYLVTSAWDPAADTGIHWDSAGITWPASITTVSARDEALPALGAFIPPGSWS
jgi:dTDP-4-dehydrorhamnose 3,5-epimerase